MPFKLNALQASLEKLTQDRPPFSCIHGKNNASISIHFALVISASSQAPKE
jgi:FPC/CPF motif-containing protein YcgG